MPKLAMSVSRAVAKAHFPRYFPPEYAYLAAACGRKMRSPGGLPAAPPHSLEYPKS